MTESFPKPLTSSTFEDALARSSRKPAKAPRATPAFIRSCHRIFERSHIEAAKIAMAFAIFKMTSLFTCQVLASIFLAILVPSLSIVPDKAFKMLFIPSTGVNNLSNTLIKSLAMIILPNKAPTTTILSKSMFIFSKDEVINPPR